MGLHSFTNLGPEEVSMRLCRMFFLCGLLVNATLATADNTFDFLKNADSENRVKLARDYYKKEFRRTDSVTTFKAFEELFAVARSLNDKVLEIWIYDFHADYFSVNRGFNELSLFYYQKAIDLSIQYELPGEIAIHTHKKGTFYNTFKHNVEAYRYFMDAYNLFKEAGLASVPDITAYLHSTANFLYHIDDFENAQRILLEALQLPMPPGDEVTMTNTLALIYRRTDNDEEAVKYFTKALNLATRQQDSVWMGIVSGNIGLVHFDHHQYDQAIPKLLLDYNLSLKGNERFSAGSALLTLIKCHLIKNNIREAVTFLKEAEPLVKEADQLELWIAYYDDMALLSEKRKDTEGALIYWKKFEAAKDSLTVINNLAAVSRVKLKWEMEKHTAQIDQLKTKARMEVLKRNSLIAGLFLLMVIVVLTYNRQVLKNKKEKELFEKQEALLQSEKNRAEEELRNATHALDLYTENLKQKNELIEEFKAEIEYLHLQLGEPPDREKIFHLEKLMQAHIMTDETWDEFKKLFEKVHAGFLYRVREKFIQATETDIRLLTLIKLGLSNREMANMLGVTTEAIKKSRQRLRKKINLPEELSLEDVVITI
jgi:tetratricopeptide (TPR) repeat protein